MLIHKTKQTGSKINCPNCHNTLREVEGLDFIFVCLNSTCNWITGPDFIVQRYLQNLKNTPEICKNCGKEVADSELNGLIHIKTNSPYCGLKATRSGVEVKREATTGVCKHCDEPVKKVVVGWLHTTNFALCNKRTTAEPKEVPNVS